MTETKQEKQGTTRVVNGRTFVVTHLALVMPDASEYRWIGWQHPYNEGRGHDPECECEAYLRANGAGLDRYCDVARRGQ